MQTAAVAAFETVVWLSGKNHFETTGREKLNCRLVDIRPKNNKIVISYFFFNLIIIELWSQEIDGHEMNKPKIFRKRNRTAVNMKRKKSGREQKNNRDVGKCDTVAIRLFLKSGGEFARVHPFVSLFFINKESRYIFNVCLCVFLWLFLFILNEPNIYWKGIRSYCTIWYDLWSITSHGIGGFQVLLEMVTIWLREWALTIRRIYERNKDQKNK